MPTDSFLFEQPLQAMSKPEKDIDHKKVQGEVHESATRFLAFLILLIVVGATLPLGGTHAISAMAITMLTSSAAAVLIATGRLHWHMAQTQLAVLVWLPNALCLHGLLQAGLGWWVAGPPGSIVPMDSFVAVLRLAGLGMFFVLAAEVARQDEARVRMLDAVLLLATGVAAWALVGRGELDGDHATGLVGTFANRNNFATFLGMALLIGVARVVEPQARHRRSMARQFQHIALLASLLILSLALVATQSRMGLVATLIGVSVILGLQSRKHMIFGATAAGAILAFALLGSGSGLLRRLPLLPQDWDLRAGFYAQIFTLIAERPLSGFGADSFALAFETHHAPGVSAAFLWDRAHSTYLELWVENGLIVGSLPIVAGFWSAFLLLQRCSANGLAARRAAKAALGALVLGGVHALFDFGLEILANQILLILLLAMGLAGPPGPRMRRQTTKEGS